MQEEEKWYVVKQLHNNYIANKFACIYTCVEMLFDFDEADDLEGDKLIKSTNVVTLCM